MESISISILTLMATFNADDFGVWEWLTTGASVITFVPVAIFGAVKGFGCLFKKKDKK